MSPAAIVLAGGRGERLRPLTDDCPKPLLDIGGEPMIAQPLRRLAAAGVTDVVLATSYRADRFEQALGDGRRYGVRLRYAVQHPPRGTGGAFAAAGPLVAGADPVLILNADELGSHDLTHQLAAFAADRARVRAAGSLHVRAVADLRPFGAVSADALARITAFVEKPVDGGPGLANAGCYVLDAATVRTVTAEAVRRADTDPEWRLSLERDVLPDLLGRGVVLTVHRDDSPGLDVGTPAALALARRRAVVGRAAVRP